MSDSIIQRRFENVSRSKTFSNIVRKFKLNKKRVLDIGCTNGEFLTHFGQGSVGLTVLKEEVEEGVRRGLDVRYGDIEASEPLELEGKVEVIFANNLFEHLASPHAFLCSIKQYLEPGGILILGVPCIPKLVFLLKFNKFRGSLASLHINFFTKETLVRTVEAGGWRVREVRGFRLSDNKLDQMLNFIYPHFYVIAEPIKDFTYSEKRIKEIEGHAPGRKW